MHPRALEASQLRERIAHHYDSLSLPYRLFWGEHLHHGYWLRPDEPHRRAQERLVARLTAAARIAPAHHVLDVGCGYGASGRWLAERVGCHVTGVTISHKQARAAARRASARHRAGRTRIIRADAERLPFGGRSFDRVWVIECLAHLVDKAAFVRQAAHLLLPGGRLAMCLWQRGPDVSHRRVAEICDAFLCASLSSERECRDWCRAAELELEVFEDLTPAVRHTWDFLIDRLSRPWLTPVRRLASADLKKFVEGFSAIGEAYDAGAMRYGLLVARRERP